MQIYNQFIKLGKYLNLKIALIIGGVSYEKQFKELSKKPNIIIGTPGRINDFIKNKKINFDHIKTFTLDEADELLNMGFKEEIEAIISNLNSDHQSFFFTATFNEKIKNMAKKIVKDDHKNIEISSGLKTSQTITQEYLLVKEKTKFVSLIKLLQYYKPKSLVIFCRTKKRVDELCDALKQLDFDAIGLHGDIAQKNRSFIMNQFRNNKKQILVTTDVAARGIDIHHIEWIINFDLPQEIEYYTHRVGRVGRKGMSGYSLSFVKIDEIEHLREIEIRTNSQIKEIFLPKEEEIYQKWRMQIDEKFQKILHQNEDNQFSYLENELMEKYTLHDLATIIAYYLLQDKHKYKKINLTPEPSVILKGQAKIRNIKNRINKFNHNSRSNNSKNNNKQNRKAKWKK